MITLQNLFLLKLVLMRIEAVLRRIREKTGNQKILTAHGIELNVDSYEVCRNGVPVKLTQLEFELLLTFSEAQKPSPYTG